MNRPRARATIRSAIDGDARAVAELWTEAYVTPGTGGRTEPYSELDFHASAERGRVFVAACEEGEVVGAVVLFAPGAPGGDLHRASGEAELSRLAVAPTARREGIGRMLAGFCTERAREAGWSAIVLWSRAAQVEGQRLYASLGYERLPDRDSVDGTGHERLVFRLILPGSEDSSP